MAIAPKYNRIVRNEQTDPILWGLTTRLSPERLGRRCPSTSAHRSKQRGRPSRALSAPNPGRPATAPSRERAPPYMSILGGTSPMPLVPPIITTFYLGTVPCIFSSLFSNYFVLYSDAEVAVNIF